MDVEPFLKSLLNLLQYCLCFMFWFFGHKGCETLAPKPGIEPGPPALGGGWSLNPWTAREVPWECTIKQPHPDGASPEFPMDLPLSCNDLAVVRTYNTGQLPGKGDLVMFAVSGFGKIFLTLQEEKSEYEILACFMVWPGIFRGRFSKVASLFA